MPGGVETDIAGNSGVTMAAAESSEAGNYKMTSAPDAARIMIDGIQSDRLLIFVGRDSRMMSAATRVAPRRAVHLIQKQMKKLMPA
jgi:hypothetical protein